MRQIFKFQEKSFNSFPIFLVLVYWVILGGYVYFYYFFHKSLWLDEGYSVITALRISQIGTPYFQSGFFDGGYLFFHLLQALSIKTLGFSDASVRIPSLLLSLGNIFLTYKISQKIFSKTSACISAITLASLYTFWSYGLQARYYSWLMFFLLLCLFFSVKYIKNPSLKTSKILLLVSTLGYLFHIFLLPFFIGGMILFSYHLYKFLISKHEKKFLHEKVKKRLTLLIGVIFAVIFFGIIEYLRVHFFSTSWAKIWGFHASNISYSLRYNDFFSRELGLLYYSIYFLPFINFFLFPKLRAYIVLLFGTFFMMFCWVSFGVFFYGERYMYFLLPILCILNIGCFMEISKKLEVPWEKWVCLLVFFSILGTHLHAVFPFWSSFSMGDTYSPEPDFESAYTYIKSANTTYSLISSYPPLDKIYWWRSDGYIYIDETGGTVKKEQSFYMKNGKNIYTGAQSISNPMELQELEWKWTYILMDDLAWRRLQWNRPLLEYIVTHYQNVFEKIDTPYFIRVYKFNW